MIFLPNALGPIHNLPIFHPSAGAPIVSTSTGTIFIGIRQGLFWVKYFPGHLWVLFNTPFGALVGTFLGGFPL